MVGGSYKFWGRSWRYGFRELPTVVPELQGKLVADDLSKTFSKLTKAWNDEVNTEWVIRIYCAARLVMGSTLHVNSSTFCENHNVGIVLPYLRYYSALNAARSLCLVLPNLEWNDGRLFKIGHGKAIAGTCDFLGRLDKNLAESVGKALRRLKAERELLSYTMPSSGPEHLNLNNDFERTCSLISEASQFVSELLVASLEKNQLGNRLRLQSEALDNILNVELEGYRFLDDEDRYRLGYLCRKHPYPASIMHMMTQGHVDDFFGAWSSKDPSDDQFDPDEDLRIIFDIP
jgi:hypothetical protein